MNSPGTPGNLDPAIDPGLLELDGAIYKDLSHSAAAQRAAYRVAMSAKLLASSSNTTTHEQTSSAPSATALLNRIDNFSNYGTAPDYATQPPGGGGNQGPGQEGWIMHSQGSDPDSDSSSSRLRFNFPFNDGSAPYTYIRAWMRGAPNNGKNSYVTLREQAWAEGSQTGFCDEIDIVEYYGQPSSPRSEWTFYQRGAGRSAHGSYPAPENPGLTDGYSYSVYLENSNYINFVFQGPDGSQLGKWERYASQGYVPTQTMYLYAGIWDCSSREGSQQWCVDTPPGPFTGDSWMALQMLYIDTGGSVLQRHP